jgi:hypothetical protein
MMGAPATVVQVRRPFPWWLVLVLLLLLTRKKGKK